MVNKKECPYCKKIIEYKHKNGFASHCANCKQRPGYWDKIDKMAKTRFFKKENYIIECKCGKKFILTLTQHNYKKDNYRKHCSQMCANTHIQTEKQNKKRSDTILKKIKSGEIIPHHSPSLKGKLHPSYKENGCERVNKEIKFKTFDKFKGICQACYKQLIKEETNNWVAHHNNKHINKEEYHDDKNRTLYCIKCHPSIHNKNVPINKLKRFRLFNYKKYETVTQLGE